MRLAVSSSKKGGTSWVDTSELDEAVMNSAFAGAYMTSEEVRRQALDMMQTIESTTPVKTGRARAGWYKAVVGLGGSWKEEGSDDSMIALGKSEGYFSDHLDTPYSRRLVIRNDVPYIDMLEYGYSKQAPAGMIRLAVLKQQGKLGKRMLAGYVAAWNKRGLGKLKRGKQSGFNKRSIFFPGKQG